MVVSLLRSKEQEHKEQEEPDLHVRWHNPHWSISALQGTFRMLHGVFLLFTTKDMMGVFWDYDGEHTASWPYAVMKIKDVSKERKN